MKLMKITKTVGQILRRSPNKGNLCYRNEHTHLDSLIYVFFFSSLRYSYRFSLSGSIPSLNNCLVKRLNEVVSQCD